jgi:ABC-2 type transport system ATP-binding protein
MPASAGSVRVGGFDVETHSMEVRRRVGYLPESVPIYRESSVRDYLRFVADVKRLPVTGLRAHLDGVMERVGLTAVAHRIVGRLSRGFRQRVGLAQALVGDPEVLVLDEPTVGLDPAQVVEVRELIRGPAGRHLRARNTARGQRGLHPRAIINRGVIVAQGTAAELTGRLAHGKAFRVRVTGDARAAAALLVALPGIETVALEPPDSATAALRVQAAGADFADDTLPRALLDGGFGLAELTPLSLSLEEIFLSVVREAGADAARSMATRGAAEVEGSRHEAARHLPARVHALRLAHQLRQADRSCSSPASISRDSCSSPRSRAPQQGLAEGTPVNVNLQLLNPLFFNMAFTVLFDAALTMRLFAEERRQGS